MVALLIVLLGAVYVFCKYPPLRKTWYWLPRRGFVALMYHHKPARPRVLFYNYATNV